MADEMRPDLVSDEEIAAALGDDLPEPLAGDTTISSDVDVEPGLDGVDLPES